MRTVMKYYHSFLLLLILATSFPVDEDDYWSDEFDVEKNCKKEKEIEELSKDTNSDKCATSTSGVSDAIQWEECKTKLAHKLVKKCAPRLIKKKGDLLYCKMRRQTTCCFQNESCVEDMTSVNEDIIVKARNFLKHPQKFLEKTVKEKGYDACFQIRGYDASKCYENCKQQEKSVFAKNCTDNGGLYKCCIRRDKEACHECRFCCTLSVCTSPIGNYFRDSEKIDQTGQDVSATDGFKIDRHLWKNRDYRCIKPKDNVNPENWPHYEMEGYRNAKTKEELESVEEHEFDRNFFNLEDPEVWKKYTNQKSGPKRWRKTYGFDFAAIIDQMGGHSNNTPCYIDCFKAENEGFAKKCKKEGGLFKCCLLSLRLDRYEVTRYELAKEELIEAGTGPTKDTRKCLPDRFSQCSMCGTTYICAKKNVLTGVVEEEFKTPYTTTHKIGGRIPERGLKYFGCFVQNTCNKIGGNEKTYEPFTPYINAATKSELCNASKTNQYFDEVKGQRNDTEQTLYYEECMKQVSPNVFVCPNTKDFPQHEQMVGITNYLKKLSVKFEKKKEKRKKSKKKSKKKRKKKRMKKQKKKGKKKGNKRQRKTRKKKRNKKQKKKRKKKKTSLESSLESDMEE